MIDKDDDSSLLSQSITFIKRSPSCLLSLGCLGLLMLTSLLLLINWEIVMPYRLEVTNIEMRTVFASIECDMTIDELVDLFEAHQGDDFLWRKECLARGLYELEFIAPFIGPSENTWVLHVVASDSEVVMATIREFSDQKRRPSEAPMDVICHGTLAEEHIGRFE